MKIIHRLSCLVLIGLLVSCANNSDNSNTSSSNVPIPTRDLLVSNDIPDSGFGAYGYVVFTNRPIINESSQPIKELALCEAFYAGLESTPINNDRNNESYMPTYWLLNREIETEAYCDSLVSNYDYSRAKYMLSTIGKLDAEGPLLVAWENKYEEATDQDALILDLSQISPEHYPEVIRIWSSQITKSPNLWNEGFKVNLIKLEFQSFLNEHGGDIVSIIWLFRGLSEST